MNASQKLVRAALAAVSNEDAHDVQQMIARSVGHEYRRPLGDTWNNHGLMGAAGSFDLKLIECVTNMQDALIERFALRAFGSPDHIPYETPHEAAADLFAEMSVQEQSQLVTVTFRDSDPPASLTKRLTAVFRDEGCGLTPRAVPRTIFRLGGSHKEDALYLQGAFGLGGALTYRNAEAAILVSRRDPDLLEADEEDRIVVAVVQWQENVKGRTAYYLVDRQWTEPGDVAVPWACPADDVPEFQPGTHLALVSYRVDGFHRKREGDERSFDVVTNTRLVRPVLPIRFVNETSRGRATTLRGLEHRLENAERQFPSGEETLPFHYEGTTYLLPITYTMFERPREAGGRDKYVAHDHAVLFTSNGQVHHHWTPQEFRNKTSLNKLYDRILITIETDSLPIRLRTSLFTADRNQIVRGDAALRLEEDVRGFIEGWDALRDENNALLREALQASSPEATADIAKKIGRALTLRGYAMSGGPGGSGGAGAGGGRSGGGGGGPSKPIPLHADPTLVTGPDHVRAVVGRTRAITYTVDVIDSFFDGRGELRAECDHLDIQPRREITIGKGRRGRVRVMVAVPDSLEPGIYELRVVLEDWLKAAGGIGPRLEHVTKLELVDEIEGQGSGSGSKQTGKNGTGGPAEGSLVALKWTNPEAEQEWERITVGGVTMIPAHVLARAQPDYAELVNLGDTPIPTVLLNEEYPPFKKYLESRNRVLTSVERPREQYAVGVGIGLLLLSAEHDRRRESEAQLPDDAYIAEAQRATARAVLAVMPAFDDLAREAGLLNE